MCFPGTFPPSSHLETLQFTLKQIDQTRLTEDFPSNRNDAVIL